MGAVLNECFCWRSAFRGRDALLGGSQEKKHKLWLQLKQDLINGGSDCVYFKIRVFTIYRHIYISKKNHKNASTAFWGGTKCLFSAATILHN